MVRALGANTNTTKLLGLMISNGLIAMSGALVTHLMVMPTLRWELEQLLLV